MTRRAFVGGGGECVGALGVVRQATARSFVFKDTYLI